MEKEIFKEIFEFQKKSKIKASEGLPFGDANFPFYTSSPLLTKSIDNHLYDGDNLVFGTGGLPSIHFAEGKFSTSTDCLVTKVKDSNKVFTKYIFYYLKNNSSILADGFKGAGLKHISKEYIGNIKIPLPDLATQKRIADILDKAAEIHDYNLQLIAKYEELKQSIFLDMFGDPVKNEKGWKLKKIQDVAEQTRNSMRTGPFGSDLLHSEFTDSGIPVLGIDNAVSNKFQWKNRRYISEEKYKKLKRYTVFPLDVIITIMGTVGRVAVVPENIGVAINTKHLAALTFDKSLVDPYFMAFVLHSDSRISSQIKKKGRGAIMTGLNLSIIKELSFYLPPLKLQKDFVSKIETIDSQISILQQQSIKSETLLNSLIQRNIRRV